MAASTTRTQRVMIWIIAAMMVIGSVGFYFLIILQNNQAADQRAELQQKLQQRLEEAKKQQAEKAAQAKPLPGYTAESFKAASVDQLVVKDLKEGDGKTVPEGATITVNYMGWLPSGELFDSSVGPNGAEPVTFSLDGVIEGWQKGIPGMKVGGVRKLVIPAGMAYGEQGSIGIPPGTPLAFIVKVEKIK